MCNRVFVTAVLFASLTAGALAPPGTAATSVEWEDPAGDANGAPRVESTPRPSDPELDILFASYAVQGENLVASIRLEKLGTAPGSFGSIYRFYFTHKDANYYMMARTATPEYPYSTDPRFYRMAENEIEDSEELKCDCKVTFDAKANTVSFSLKMAALKKALKGGGELTDLYVKTLRRANLFIDADTARAPEKASLTV
ncbi:MAG: hypothetical protein KY395_01445 [Actinobacteria bacterium]|nr:hypothetical protein [Actinomycetota bacterium]